ncbi:hypothetical protein AL755_01925 (plasmid) [Arthrobacter sp. ERGS1:01]|uniref:Lrp/AsnC family transcriptional regulator n=1 Tax=Arthrobacter sp. ERGS1:01 TaxID=1704044 RepID=UPI0006B67569|nr:AsnC family transcriptional regulator [Arthrobacter sp. ERGS1:01]ALE04460.1 hypothetical protein AL755_01925 [Arthrobacter sp. ERGS1:01]
MQQLQLDGRASFSDLARAVGSNRTVVAAHVNELLNSGKVRVIAAIHPRVLGLEVLAHLAIKVSGDPGEALAGLDDLDSAVYISETTGTYQIVMEVRMPAMGGLYDTIAYVNGLPTVQEVNVLVYERVIRSLFLGEEPAMDRVALDQTDIDIMRILQRDGRTGFAEIGEAVGASMSTCRSRVLRLLDANIMQVGAIESRSDTSGTIVFGCGMSLAGNESAAVVEHLAGVDGVEFVARTIGRYAMVATIAVGSQRDYNQVVRAIRALRGVKHLETWLHTNILQERYENTLEQLVPHGSR